MSNPNFPHFAQQIRANFEALSKGKLYYVDIERDDLWQTYLESFPEGTNPIFRERTEHDCSCCRHFIKNVGNVVSIEDGSLRSVWDNYSTLPEPYKTVSDTMSRIVHSAGIKHSFLTGDAKYGAEVTPEITETSVINWHHFSADIPRIMVNPDRASVWSKERSTVGVFKRGLEEIDSVAIETVKDLIDSGNLYRGDEHKTVISSFTKLQEDYRKLNSETARNIFLWENFSKPGARLRNNVIGTLLQDISSGEDLEVAVKKYEVKVAPANYQRPKALITKRMVSEAMKKIKELDLEPSLERRHAKLSDISVNDVLWASSGAEEVMSGGLESLLLSEVKDKTPDFSKAPEVSFEEFMEDVAPKCSSISVNLKGSFVPNFMSLTSPVHDDSKRLFQWDNDFSWSYSGDLADSGIKEKVKAAGGRTVGAKLRISLAWHNSDDLDLHLKAPGFSREIYFGSMQGILDVDMNAGTINSVDPVENCSFMDIPKNGIYKVYVRQYRRRGSSNTGFTLEIESDGTLYSYSSPKSPTGKWECLHIEVKGGVVYKIHNKKKDHLTEGQTSGKEHWGVQTNSLVEVSTIMNSPNHWEDNEKKKGNKHRMFILAGCQNPEPVRGIYNEFLSPELKDHRKVWEVLGSKTKAPYSDEQLSGIGFSTTKPEVVELVCKTEGKTLNYNVQL